MLANLGVIHMTDLHERAAEELHAIVAQYSAGEAEVVTAYFQQDHTTAGTSHGALPPAGSHARGASRRAPAADGPRAADLQLAAQRAEDAGRAGPHPRPP